MDIFIFIIFLFCLHFLFLFISLILIDLKKIAFLLNEADNFMIPASQILNSNTNYICIIVVNVILCSTLVTEIETEETNK